MILSSLSGHRRHCDTAEVVPKAKFTSDQISPLKVRKVVLTKGTTLQGMQKNRKGDQRVKKVIHPHGQVSSFG